MKQYTVFILLLFSSTMATAQDMKPPKNRKKLKKNCGQTWQLLSDHKNKLMGTSIVGLYAYLLYKALRENDHLAQDRTTIIKHQEMNHYSILINIIEVWTIVKTSIVTPITETIAGSRKWLEGFWGDAWQLVSGHKYKLIGTSIVGTYTYLLYKALRGNSYLAQDDSWFSWEKELSMGQLLSIPQKELAQRLLTQVQHRYLNAANPTDFLSPLINFMRDIEAEINQLRIYNRIYKWTETINLSNILPFNKKRFKNIQEKIQRLLYFKNIFSSWVAHYKMVRNTSK